MLHCRKLEEGQWKQKNPKAENHVENGSCFSLKRSVKGEEPTKHPQRYVIFPEGVIKLLFQVRSLPRKTGFKIPLVRTVGPNSLPAVHNSSPVWVPSRRTSRYEMAPSILSTSRYSLHWGSFWISPAAPLCLVFLGRREGSQRGPC